MPGSQQLWHPEVPSVRRATERACWRALPFLGNGVLQYLGFYVLHFLGFDVNLFLDYRAK
jgi:hypothetical protein